LNDDSALTLRARKLLVTSSFKSTVFYFSKSLLRKWPPFTEIQNLVHQWLAPVRTVGTAAPVATAPVAPVQDDNVVVVEGGGGGTTAPQPVGYGYGAAPVARSAAFGESMYFGSQCICLLVCIVIVVVIIIVVLAALRRLDRRY
jgi:hypothetical protein